MSRMVMAWNRRLPFIGNNAASCRLKYERVFDSSGVRLSNSTHSRPVRTIAGAVSRRFPVPAPLPYQMLARQFGSSPCKVASTPHSYTKKTTQSAYIYRHGLPHCIIHAKHTVPAAC